MKRMLEELRKSVGNSGTGIYVDAAWDCLNAFMNAEDGVYDEQEVMLDLKTIVLFWMAEERMRSMEEGAL